MNGGRVATEKAQLSGECEMAEFYEGARCSSVNRKKNGCVGVFKPNRSETYFMYARTPDEAELAIALMKAEWIFQECEAVGGVDVVRRLLHFYSEG